MVKFCIPLTVTIGDHMLPYTFPHKPIGFCLTLRYLFQLKHRFFGDSMWLQASPIISFWNWNRFLDKQVQKPHRISKKWFYATLCESLILYFFWNRNCFLDLRVQKLWIGLAWSHVKLYRLAWDRHHKKLGKIRYLIPITICFLVKLMSFKILVQLFPLFLSLPNFVPFKVLLLDSADK